jgi:hypothetical protein
MRKLYAGVGSRQTPKQSLNIMFKLAAILARRGYTLRSGAADGADAAFEQGCDSEQGDKEIWLPWKGFNGHAPSPFLPTDDHMAMGAVIHPAWFGLSDAVKKLHARNSGQILGRDLKTPVDFCVCYTSDGAELYDEVKRTTGGTGTAIRLASSKGIPVFNLLKGDSVTRLKHFLMDAHKASREEAAPCELPYTWSRQGGYEVSSKGDKRFSALYAIMPDGRSLECHYQLDTQCKGYNPGGTNWKLGKGKPPLDPSTNLWEEYLKLWRIWEKDHLPEMQDLKERLVSYNNKLSDMFATTEVNQAHALATILNESQPT